MQVESYTHSEEVLQVFIDLYSKLRIGAVPI